MKTIAAKQKIAMRDMKATPMTGPTPIDANAIQEVASTPFKWHSDGANRFSINEDTRSIILGEKTTHNKSQPKFQNTADKTPSIYAR